MGYWEKAQQSAEEGAHVAAVLYATMHLDQTLELGYGNRELEAVTWLNRYRSNLKKETDQKALEDILGVKYGALLDRADCDVDITATVKPRHNEVQIT